MNVSRQVAGQHQRQPRHFVWLADAAGRQPLAELDARLDQIKPEAQHLFRRRFCARRQDAPGQNSVDAETVPGILLGQGARQGNNAGLADAIVGQVFLEGQHGFNRTQVDNHARLPSREMSFSMVGCMVLGLAPGGKGSSLGRLSGA